MSRSTGAGPALMAPRYQVPEGQESGPNPTDRGKLGSKRHIVVDARGIPLVILVSGANRQGSKMFEKCVDAIPAITGLPGRPRKRPAKPHANKCYDFKRCRAHLRQRGIESSERLAGQAPVGGGEDTQLVCRLWQAANPL